MSTPVTIRPDAEERKTAPSLNVGFDPTWKRKADVKNAATYSPTGYTARVKCIPFILSISF